MRNAYLYFILLILLCKNVLSQDFKALDRPINSPLTSEFEPSLSANGRIILFSTAPTDVKGREIMISYQRAGAWSRPEPILSLNNLSTPVHSYTLSYDGNTIFFSMSKYGGIGALDLWYIEKTNNGWTEPKNLGKPVNSIGSEVDPSLSPDGKYLYFVRIGNSKSTGASNCGKIFTVERRSKDIWGEPRELVNTINKGCEANPNILSDNSTLTFSSIRMGGKGGFDQYKSTLNPEGKWPAPIPLSFINTPGDDRYISIQGPGDYVYLSRPAKLGTDIVRTNIPEELRPKKVLILQGLITDNASNKGLPGKIVLTNLKSNQLKIFNYSAGTNYCIVVSEKEKFDISFFSANPKYSFSSMILDLDTLHKYKEMHKDVKLQELKLNNRIPLNNISFSNQELNPDSYRELNRLLHLLHENPGLFIEIGVSDTLQEKDPKPAISDSSSTILTDSLNNKTTFLIDRTMEKAQLIIDYLVSKGIKAERLKATAYEDIKQQLVELKILKE